MDNGDNQELNRGEPQPNGGNDPPNGGSDLPNGGTDLPNGGSDLPEGATDDAYANAVDAVSPRISPRGDPMVHPLPPDPREIVSRLTGLPSPDLPSQGNLPAVSPQKELGLPASGHDPERVVIQLRSRRRLSVAEHANVACALGWLGFDDYQRHRGAEARAEYVDAAAELDLARKDATGAERSRIDAFGEAIAQLQALAK